MAAYIVINGVVQQGSKGVALSDAEAPSRITILWQTNLNPTDYIEVYVGNDSGVGDVLASTAVLRVN